MCGAMKGAVTGALVFEGLATDLEDAARLAASGDITFSPCHEHDCGLYGGRHLRVDVYAHR